MKMDMNKMLRQVQEMQAQMAKAQDELANETVETLPTNRDGLKAYIGQVPGIRTNLDVGASSMTDTVSIRAYGQVGNPWLMLDGVMTGYWEWFRKDGSIMRSGHFENGEQVGEWTTYDRVGKAVKVTKMKPKKAK